VPDSVEEQVDLEDWDIFRRLARLADHWWWRPGWHPERHYLTWFILFDGDPELHAHIARMQAELADLDYLDPVPADGLHMTIQGVAFADELTPDQVATLTAEAARRCAELPPFTLTVGPANGFDAGTFLRATPWHPVAELRRRLREAVAAVLGEDRVPDGEPAVFKPHISLAYCHAAVPAADLIDRVTRLRELPHAMTTITGVDLVEQRREQHTYRWDVRHHVELTGEA
jgi:2'-5' RNA ligase